MLNTLFLKSGNYTYKVTYKQVPGLPKSRLIKRNISPVRPKSITFYDKYDNTFKEVVYPEKLHYMIVAQDDPVENYVYDLMELIPDWQKIEVCDY